MVRIRDFIRFYLIESSNLQHLVLLRFFVIEFCINVQDNIIHVQKTERLHFQLGNAAIFII